MPGEVPRRRLDYSKLLISELLALSEAPAHFGCTSKQGEKFDGLAQVSLMEKEAGSQLGMAWYNSAPQFKTAVRAIQSQPLYQLYCAALRSSNFHP